MTNQQHPITPPPELVEQWAHMLEQHTDAEVFNRAARWGADQELEACCEWIYKLMDRGLEWSMDLRVSRRPKPPSPKEEALQVLENLLEARRIVDPEYQALRHALEQLDD